jgi:hypothetical protein
MTVVAAETSAGLIRWRYLPWALSAIAAMIAVILAGNIWLLDFVHVFSSLLCPKPSYRVSYIFR